MKVCMLAYAQYFSDARIKSYVRTLEDQGHQVDVIALKEGDESAVKPLRAGNVFHITSKYQGQSSLMYVWSYLKFFLKSMFFLAYRSLTKRYDAVHVHNMPNALIFAALMPKLFGARLFLDVHDLMMANYMAKFGGDENALPVKVLKFEQRISAMLADHMFCADDNQRDYLIANCGVKPEKIAVQLNLPNVELFSGTRSEKKPGTFRIVYHGTIAHRLGIDLIVRAVAKAREQVPVELWMYGAGDFLTEVRALATELKLDDHAHFSGTFFPVEQIPVIVSGMDLGIIGNRRSIACDKYMLPVKLLEYVYLGVPVIAPRLDVISRYFDDHMVRFYEPENVDQIAAGIVELYKNKEERERLANAATSFYQKHSIQAQADVYLNLITGSPTGLRAQSQGHA